MRRPALIALATLALTAAAPAARALEVVIVRPNPGDAVFGPTTVVAEIYPLDAEVDRVEFFLDGFLVGQATEPPWEVLFDAGSGNVAHRIVAVAHGVDGETATSELTTATVRVDAEVDVNLRQLYISFDDRSSSTVYDRSDFEVLDSGVRQEIVTFETGDAPFSAVLLLDASASMRGEKLRTALAAARSFVGRLDTLDEAKLILFSDRILRETPFTNFVSLLTLGLSDAVADGGTAINDALYLAHKRLELRQGRKVIFLLSDGVDIESILTIDKVRALSQRHEAALYWVRLGGAEAADRSRLSAWRSAAGHRHEIDGLRDTAGESGGRILPIDDVSALEQALAELLAELRSQYVIGYYPSLELGSGAWHEIEVRLEGDSRGLRTRRGYLEF